MVKFQEELSRAVPLQYCYKIYIAQSQGVSYRHIGMAFKTVILSLHSEGNFT